MSARAIAIHGNEKSGERRGNLEIKSECPALVVANADLLPGAFVSGGAGLVVTVVHGSLPLPMVLAIYQATAGLVSTRRLSAQRKSTPMMGKVTAARMNYHWKVRLEKSNCWAISPPAVDCGPIGAYQVGALDWCGARLTE